MSGTDWAGAEVGGGVGAGLRVGVAAGVPVGAAADRTIGPVGAAARGRTGVRWTDLPWPLLALIALGLGLRLAAAGRFAPHVDEGNMVLGIHTAAETGRLVLPSGVAYLHGATLSYLLAPLVWLGWGEVTDLFQLRVASAVFGAVAVWLTYRLTRALGLGGGAALVAAGLVAIDPLNVLWGGYVRMYALLQVLVLLVAWLFVAALGAGSGRARGFLVGLVVAFWLAVFTQVVAALLWPALALAALLFRGRALLGPRRDLAVALGCCLLAPAVFLALSTLIGPGSGTVREAQTDWFPLASFLGNDALDPTRFLEPDLRGFRQLYQSGPLGGLVPTLIAVLSGLVVGRHLLAPTVPERPGRGVDRRGLACLLLLFWLPFLGFAVAVAEQKVRYFLGILPLGYVLVGAAVAAVADLGVGPGRRLLGRAAAAGVVLLLVVHAAGGLWGLGETAAQQAEAGSFPALAYVAERAAADDWIVVGTTPESYLVLGERPTIRVFGGVLERPGSDPRVDNWIGWEYADSAESLCPLLTERPGTWLVLGQNRLDARRPTTGLVLGATDVLFQSGEGQVVVYRSLEPAAWDEAAVQACRGDGGRAG